MKTSLRRISGVLAALAVSPMLVGCNAASNPPFAEAADLPPTATAPATTNLAQPEPQAAAEVSGVTEAPVIVPEVPFDVERPLPENIRARPALAQVVKLAQSGVDEEVLLAFVGNVQAGFALGANEIIFLNDLGISTPVVTAMISRDKELGVAASTGADATITTVTAVSGGASQPTMTAEATAPSYVNPPTAEAGNVSEPSPVSETTFDEALSPYGSWINVEGYGRVWQPTVAVVNPRWRPYADGGRWLYTDVGWYWYSDYSWGWAPFHYGRWFVHPRWGWCWRPGFTWAPAWVSWRYTSGFCGWAPLPPAAVFVSGVGLTWHGSSVGWGFGFGLGFSCYTFVPWNFVCAYRPHRHCLPPDRSQAVYNNSTVVNNIINGNNNTIVNNGIPVTEVVRRGGTEIRPVKLRDAVTSPSPSRREHLTTDGRTLVVQRPRLADAPQESADATAARVVPSQGSGVAALTQNRPSGGGDAAGAGSRLRTSSPPRDSVVATGPSVQSESGSAGRPALARPVEHSGRPTSVVPSGADIKPAPPVAGSMIPPARPAATAPPGSMVVIGQRPNVTPRGGDGKAVNHAGRSVVREQPRPVAGERVQATAPAVGALAASTPADTVRPAAPTHTWSPRPSATPQRQEVISVSRSIQNRPAGSPNYTIYSPSTQRPTSPSVAATPSAPSAPITGIQRSAVPPASSSHVAATPSPAPAQSYAPRPAARSAPSSPAVSRPPTPAPQARPVSVPSRPASPPSAPPMPSPGGRPMR